ncbi:MAG: hypothetical protein KGI50_02410 [Patescibacteria group bacterium]|nr:hypothetical protein [Patescibacteria group bacterium]MDE2437801.1 hypothetical protein [Patescibacteria group bacterium]
MDTFAKIKKILEYGSGKAVVLDGAGDPEFIVLSWREYEKMLHAIDVLRSLPEQRALSPQPAPSDKLSLDDLPYR